MSDVHSHHHLPKKATHTFHTQDAPKNQHTPHEACHAPTTQVSEDLQSKCPPCKSHPMIYISRILVLQHNPMSVRGGWLDDSAWSAADARWFAEVITQCTPLKSSAQQPSSVFAELNDILWTKCIQMVGDADEDGAYVDSTQHRWYADRKGRWSAKIAKKKVYLHHRVLELQPNRTRRTNV